VSAPPPCSTTLPCQPLLQAVFTNYGFHFPLTVALLQMAFIAPVSYAVARPQLSWALVRQLAPLAMVNVMNVVSGLIGAWASPGSPAIAGSMGGWGEAQRIFCTA